MHVCVGHTQRPIAAKRAFLVKAMRCWCSARRETRLVQPHLAHLLAPCACEVLAPVLDGLFSSFEACLGRPVVAGHHHPLARDELDLLALLSRPASADSRFPQSPLNTVLRVALCSTRIMVSLTPGAIGERTLAQIGKND